MANPEEITVVFNGDLPLSITKRKRDDLPAHVKGTAEWHSRGPSGAGYYIPQHHSPSNSLEPIEFINNRWFGLSVRNRQHFTQANLAIDISNIFSLGYWNTSDPQHPDNQTTQSSSAPLPPTGPPVDIPDPTTLSISTIAPVTSTAPAPDPATMSVNATMVAPTPSNGLKGIASTIFTGDRSKADTFMNEFRRYRLLNRNNESISIPFYRVLTALSYIKGPLVEDWVNARDHRLERQIDIRYPDHTVETDEDLWTDFENSFKSTWRDTSRSANAYDQLMKLTMKDLDVDTYTASFERLAAAAEWEPNAKGTIARYRAGLRENIHRRILNRENLPTTMEEWKDAARKEVNRTREIYNAGLSNFRKGQQSRDFGAFHSQQSRPTGPARSNGVVPMDVDATQLTLPFKKLTDEERARYRAEGRCFRCRIQGHMARNCPKNSKAQSLSAHEATTGTPTATPNPAAAATSTPTPTPPTKLTIAQQIRALEEQMTEEERGAYLDARDMGEDFCYAGL